MNPPPSRLEPWPVPFDPGVELSWGDPVISRRLLREHLDQSHDGASRRTRLVDRHTRRLMALLPPPPASILDAACGPGLYAVRLAAAGHRVHGVDIGPAVISWARRLARELRLTASTSFSCADILAPHAPHGFDAAILIYHVLEAFPRRRQRAVLRRLRDAVVEGGTVVVEMRLRPEQAPGRVSSWDVVRGSLLSDRRHLLLVETVYDQSRNTFVLRETAVFDDGTTAIQQTSSALTRLGAIPALFAQAGLEVQAVFDGWTRELASELSDTALVVARSAAAPSRGGVHQRPAPARRAGAPRSPSAGGSRPR